MNTSQSAAFRICQRMTGAGFMSGWFGDESEAFIADQAAGLVNLTTPQLEVWLVQNEHNMRSARVDYLDVAFLYGEKRLAQ